MKVRIWRDPWIPREFSLRVSTLRGRQRSKWVAELLDTSGRDWDYNKLVAMFNPADVEAIAKIKIPARASEDVLAWHFERTGTFTVRSAYNLGMQLKHKQDAQATSSSPNGDRKIWSNIWKVEVPSKVRIFAWKLSKEILPTKENKFKRKLEAEDMCDIWGLISETSFHAVVDCQQAYNLRRAMREHWELPAENCFVNSGLDWLLILLDGCTREQKENALLVLWRAWLIHNNITHGSGPTGVLDSVHALLCLKSSYRRAINSLR
jgi:hypothetical protein